MKISRLFSSVLLAFIIGTAATAQESAEIASLRAKAERGNGIAQYNLGLAYLEGRGTTADRMEAYVWLSLARENGARGRALDSLVGSLDRVSLEAAQQKLSAYKAAAGISTPAPVRAEPTPARTEPRSAEPDAPRPPPGGAAAPLPVEPRSAPGEDSGLARLSAERDALATRLNELNAEVTALRADRQRLVQQAAESEKSAAAGRQLQEQVRTAETRIAALSREAESAKAELAQTRQALAALEQAPKPAPDTAALDAKTRELQTALTELEASRNFTQQVETTLNKVTDQKSALEAQLAANLTAIASAQAEVSRAKQEIATLTAAKEAAAATAAQARQALAALEQAPKPAPDTAALDAKTRELQAALTELETSRNFGRKVEITLNQVAEQKSALEARLAALNTDLAATAAARTEAQAQIAALTQAKADAETALAQAKAAPAYPDLSGKVTELERALTAARQAAPAYPDLSGRVRDLEGQIATLTQSAAETQQALAAARQAKPAYPDLSARVSELESQLTKANSDLSAVGSAKADLSGQVAELAAKLASTEQALAAKPAAPAYPDLRSNVTALEAQLATAKAAQPAYPDLSGQVASLENQIATLNTEAGRSRQEIAALTQSAAETQQALAAARQAKPAYPDLTARVAELEAALAAKPAAPSYPDLSGRVSELEVKLADTEKSLAAKPATPAYPDLSDQVRQLEQTLADTNRQLIAAQNAKPAAPAYPDLSGRVAELEAQLAKSGESSAAAVAKAELSRAELAKQFDAYKSATVASQRESTTLQASVKMLESDKASLRRQVEAATAEAGQLRTQVAALKTAAAAIKPAAPAYPDLSGKVGELEAQLASLNADQQTAQALVGGLRAERDVARSTQNELRETVAKLTQDNAGLVAAADAARNAAPSYPDLSGQVRELEAQLAAKPATPAYPDLSGRVSELEAKLASTSADLTAARTTTPSYPDLSGRVRELESQLAALTQSTAETQQALATARQAKPAYPDLSARVSELESQLAKANTDLSAADSAKTDLSAKVRTLETELAGANQQADQAVKSAVAANQQSTADLNAARVQIDQLKTALAEKPAAPAYPDLSGRVTELEARLAQTEKPAAPAYPDLSDKVSALESTISSLTGEIAQAKQSRAELAKQFDAYKSATVASQRESTTLQASVKMLESDKSSLRRQVEAATTEAGQLRTQVAALKTAAAAIKPAAPAYPDLTDKVTALENQIAVLSARPAAPTYPDLSGRVSELEAKLAAAGQAPAVQPAAPAYPDLSGKVGELESALAESSRQVVAANTALAQTQQQLADANARPKGEDSAQLRRERDELSNRMVNLASELAQLRSDRERMQKMLADTGRQLRDNTADAARIKELEASLTVLTAEAGQARQQAAALASAKDAAESQASGLVTERDAARSMQNDLRTTIARLEQEKAQLAAAVPAAPAYPDLSGRVAELEAQLARTVTTSVPAYPNLTDKVGALENQIAVLTAQADRSRQEIAALTQARDEAARNGRTPAYPDLSGRVNELEAALADTKRQLGDTQVALQTEQAKPAPAPAVATADLSGELAAAKSEAAALAKAKDEAEDKLAIALRGYAALERDRDSLAARASQSAEAVTAERNTLAAQVETLTREVAQLRTGAAAQAEALNQATALATDKRSLETRLAEVEGRVNAAQAEAARATESLAALQRTSAQTINELASTRALAQQLQGSNTVLANENYQLKTMLARSVGTPAPASAAPTAAPALAAGRTHIIVSGDSLTRISQRYYGNANRWPDIYNANRDKIGADGILRVGVELRIP